MARRIAVLGSTGSIGMNALKVVRSLGGEVEVVALSCGSSVHLLARQIKEFRPRIVSVMDEKLARTVSALAGAGTRVVWGTDGLGEIVARADIDLVVFAMSGMTSIIPLMEAIRRKKMIALANKESIVCAGPVIMRLAKSKGVVIVPIDSEHNAIFQCLEGRDRATASKIILTGSGGPLLEVPKRRFDGLSREAILRHPKWRMGRKITVDSATMMNKGFEIIEAEHLFGFSPASIEVVIHPEAIIHSMVEFIDGSVLAQLAVPDMRIPIQHALTYPARRGGDYGQVAFTKFGSLSFRAPDVKKFPCLRLAREAASAGGLHPAVLCSADEAAVDQFLEGRIRFTDIPKIIEKVLGRCARTGSADGAAVGDIIRAQEEAREEARRLCYR